MSLKIINAEIITKTQNTLGNVIKKPPLTEKLLSKPPFRFLHDICTSVIKTTGFMKGLFSETEMDSDNVKDKEAKLEFLQKVIDFISLVTGEKVPSRPSKMIAGAEPEKTNEMLQLLALAINKNVDNDEYVKRFLSPSLKESETTKTRSEDGEERKKRKEKSSQDKENKSDDKKRIHGDEQNEEKPEEKKEKRKEKDEKKERKHRSKDGEKKRDDGEKRRDDGEKRRDDGEKRRDGGEKNEKHKEDRKKRKNGEEDEAKHKRSEKDEEHRKGSERKKDEKSKNGKNRDEKNKDEKNEDEKNKDEKNKDEKNKDEKNKDEKNKDEKRSKRRKEDEEGGESEERSRSKRHTKERSGSRRHSRERHKREKEEQKEEEKGLVGGSKVEKEDVRKNRQSSSERDNRLSRPNSARPAPPKPKQVTQIAEVAIPTMEKKMDVVDDDDDDDDDYIIKDDAMPLADETVVEVESGQDAAEHGTLVKNILESKKELELVAAQKSTAVHKDEYEGIQKKEKEGMAQQIEEIREMVQLSTKSINPLGKTMDFLQEDMDSMLKELNTWNEETKANQALQQAEESKTEAVLEPMKKQLRELDQAILMQLSLISAVESNIIENDAKINVLFSSLFKA